MRRIFTLCAVGALALNAVAACSSGSGGGSSKTITVAYQKFGQFIQMDDHMKKVKAAYEPAHAGFTVKLVPIEAAENDYYTKLSLMNRSPGTAPDVMYEDTFFTDLVQVTHFRPAYADYPHVSDAIQVAMESVMTGQQSPQQAVQAYGDALRAAVGPGKVK